jgi:hypothetical protein
MVEDRYWGRSATGKQPLADGDVARLVSQRDGHADRFAAELAGMDETVDPLPPDQRTRGRLYVMVQPVTRPAIALSDAVGRQRVLEIVLPTLQQQRPQWATGFEQLGYQIPHPDGLAAATDAPGDWDAAHEEIVAFLLLRDDGTVQFASGDAVRTWDGGPPCISLPAVCEAVQEVAAIAGRLSTEYLRYTGQWRLGLRVTGLRGLYPSQHYHPSRSYGFSPFQTDTYTRTAVVSLQQLIDPSSAVVETVAANLARGLNLDRLVFPYSDIGQLAAKLR